MRGLCVATGQGFAGGKEAGPRDQRKKTVANLGPEGLAEEEEHPGGLSILPFSHTRYPMRRQECCCSGFGGISRLSSSLFILLMLPSFLPKTQTTQNTSDRTISLFHLGSSLAYYCPSTIWMGSSLTHFRTLTPTPPTPRPLQGTTSLRTPAPRLRHPSAIDFAVCPHAHQACSCPALFH